MFEARLLLRALLLNLSLHSFSEQRKLPRQELLRSSIRSPCRRTHLDMTRHCLCCDVLVTVAL